MSFDQQLFQQAMRGVQPIRPSDRARVNPPPTTPTPAQLARRKAALHGAGPLSLELGRLFPAHDPLDWCKDGVQAGVHRKLRLGLYRVDARLNLAGLSPAAALDELLSFVADCRRQEVRTALIDHGRGHHDAAKGNQLRSYLAQWLPELPAVQAFHSAQPAHGGLAATYLMLAKSDSARDANRERQRKGRP